MPDDSHITLRWTPVEDTRRIEKAFAECEAGFEWPLTISSNSADVCGSELDALKMAQVLSIHYPMATFGLDASDPWDMYDFRRYRIRNGETECFNLASHLVDVLLLER